MGPHLDALHAEDPDLLPGILVKDSEGQDDQKGKRKADEGDQKDKRKADEDYLVRLAIPVMAIVRVILSVDHRSKLTISPDISGFCNL